MNLDQFLWSLLLLCITASLLALPFWPAWSEWRHPRDQGPTPPPPEAARLANRPANPAPLHLAPGARFETLQARTLLLGIGTVPAPAALNGLQRWQPPADARPWGVQGWHIAHHLEIAAGQFVPCSLVVRGRLHTQGGSRILGNIKARDGLHLGPDTQVQGNLFSEGDIWLGAGCNVSGLVMAEGRLHMAPGVVIGSPEHNSSLCADFIDVHGPVRVHGSVQARLGGQVADL